MEAGQRPLLLMLGADRYALRACVRHGIDGVVVCGPFALDDGLVRIPDGFTLLPVDDQRSAESVLMALHRAGLGGRRFDGVQTSDERALVTASVLAAHLGCAFMAPETAVGFRDKSVQKRRVTAAGVPAAAVTVIDDIHDVTGITALPYPRAVLKPVAGAATALTSVVRDVAELRARSREYRRRGVPHRTFVLEEHCEGEEWLADGVVFDGELLFCSLARYSDPCLVSLDSGAAISISRLDPERDDQAYRLAIPVVQRSLEALALRVGVFHMELFHQDGRLAFSECAARRGGALIHEELQAKSNVDLAESAVLCALGRRPDLQVKNDPRLIGGGFLIGAPGTLAACPTPAEVAARPGVLFARVERPWGTVIGDDLASTNQRLGQYLVAAEDEEELARRHAEVRAWFAERTTIIPAGATGRELRAWQRRQRPDADFGDTLWS